MQLRARWCCLATLPCPHALPQVLHPPLTDLLWAWIWRSTEGGGLGGTGRFCVQPRWLLCSTFAARLVGLSSLKCECHPCRASVQGGMGGAEENVAASSTCQSAQCDVLAIKIVNIAPYDQARASCWRGGLYGRFPTTSQPPTSLPVLLLSLLSTSRMGARARILLHWPPLGDH
jgi:hypothetical protein